MSTTTTTPSMLTPWVERYRPKTLSEVSHQTEIVATLHNAIETNRLPHLLFYGPPGTGKTSVAMALCHHLWHPSQYKRRVLELNASDERGISVVRNKIKSFASQAVGSSAFMEQNNKDTKKYPNPPFKIIILDEADAVTPDAQAALRRVIEAYSKITRFILICNYVTRIISPLSSRCAKFRFQPLPPASMLQRLSDIAQAEQCEFENKEQVFNEILALSDGDMRRAVTTLQSAHALSSGGQNKVIQLSDISEITGLPSQEVIEDLIKGLQNESFNVMETAVMNVIAEGYSAPTVISSLLDHLVLSDSPMMDDEEKALLCIKMAEADKCLVDGADETLQLMSVCSLASRCLAKKL